MLAKWPDGVGMDGVGVARRTLAVSDIMPQLSSLRKVAHYPLSAFAAFFTVFEITRRTSSHVKRNVQQVCEYSDLSSKKKANIPKIANACSLVGGGVRYRGNIPVRPVIDDA